MSSLAIFVDQIMRPSFLPNYEAPARRPAQPVAEEKLRQVLACLKAAGKPVSSRWVMDYTGYTKQSVCHLLYKLEQEEEVVKIQPLGEKLHGKAFTLWELR